MPETNFSRRWFLAAVAGSLTACQFPSRLGTAPVAESPAPPLGREPYDLLELASAYVRAAEESRTTRQLWGRIGGSREEGAAGRLFAEHLRPWVNSVDTESFRFDAWRPNQWRLELSGGVRLESAMPAPVDARFPDGGAAAPVQMIGSEADWDLARGRWIFVPGRAGDTLQINAVSDADIYLRAVEAGAAGLVFSLPTPEGTWRSIVRTDSNESAASAFFREGLRPIPCYCVDAADGLLLREAAAGAAELKSHLIYDPRTQQSGANIIGILRGDAPPTLLAPGAVGVFANLDGFFSGASDNASGLATVVGIAQRLARGPRLARRSDLYFAGLSAHHDGGAGLRAFIEADPRRFARLKQIFFVRRTDPGTASAEAPAGSVAYLGPKPWSSLSKALPELLRESGYSGEAPRIVEASALGPDIERRGQRTFSLQSVAPRALTDHDALGTLSAAAMERAVEFYLRAMETGGALVPGTFRESLRTAPPPIVAAGQA